MRYWKIIPATIFNIRQAPCAFEAISVLSPIPSWATYQSEEIIVDFDIE